MAEWKRYTETELYRENRVQVSLRLPKILDKLTLVWNRSIVVRELLVLWHSVPASCNAKWHGSDVSAQSTGNVLDNSADLRPSWQAATDTRSATSFKYPEICQELSYSLRFTTATATEGYLFPSKTALWTQIFRVSTSFGTDCMTQFALQQYLYQQRPITCCLSSLSFYTAAVGTAWSLLGSHRNGQAKLYLFQKHLLCLGVHSLLQLMWSF